MMRCPEFALLALLLGACGGSGAHGDSDADAGLDGFDAAVVAEARDAAGDAGSADAADEILCACDDSAPVCIPDTGECVECTDDAAEACRGSTPFCGADQQCVACLADTDCPEGNAPVCRAGSCTGCESDAECGDARICDNGRCGECTSARSDACTIGSVAHVCDVLARTCSVALPGSATACENCVSDAHCAAGLACVEHRFAGKVVGTFCMPRQAAGACVRPYTEPQVDVTTIEGATVSVCAPKLASCPALVGASGYGAACGVDGAGLPVTTGAVRGDDGLCGMKGVDDAVCVEGSRPLDFHCTLTCTDGTLRNANLCPAQSREFPGAGAPSCKAAEHYPAGGEPVTAFACGS